MGLKWDGHDLFSLDIVGKLKWDNHVLTVCELKGDRGKDVRKAWNKMLCISIAIVWHVIQ